MFTQPLLNPVIKTLGKHRQWVLYNKKKIPINPHTGEYSSSTDPSTWGTLEDVLKEGTNPKNTNGDIKGLGFCFHEKGDLVGIDMDHCVGEDGTLNDEAQALVDSMDSYTEISPSGRGIHIFVYGNWGGGNKSKFIEVYDQARYFTVTGNHLKGTPLKIKSRQPELDGLREKYFGSDNGSDQKNYKDIKINFDAGFPKEKFDNLYSNHEKFRQTWEHMRKVGTDPDQLADDSLSTHDWSMACIAAHDGWSDDEIVALIIEHRTRHGDVKKANRRDYMGRLLVKAQEIRDEKAEKSSQKKTETPKIKLLTASEIRAKLGPTDWNIRGYIERNTTGVLFGDPGTYKSFIAFGMACAIATGKPWHGCPVKKGPVVVVNGEGAGGLPKRLTGWEMQNKVKVKDDEIFFTEKSINGSDKASISALVEAIDAVAPENPGLIVLDTVARNFGPGDENNTMDMNRFVNNIDEMIRAKYKCTVLLIHHSGHKEKARARGSVALRGASDYEYRLVKHKSLPLTVTMDCMKMKDGPPPKETMFVGKSIFIGFYGDEELNTLVFSKTDQVVREEKINLTGKRGAFYNLFIKLKDSKGRVDRVVMNDAANDAGFDEKSISRILFDLKKMRILDYDKSAIWGIDLSTFEVDNDS